MKKTNKQLVIDRLINIFGPTDRYGSIKFATKPSPEESEREYRIVFKPRVVRWEVKSVCRTIWIKRHAFGYNDAIANSSIEKLEAFYLKCNCYRK